MEKLTTQDNFRKEGESDMDQYDEYIVAYSASAANSRLVADDEHFYHSEMMDLYKFALARKDKKYGDIVAWNNQFWGVIKAENSIDALTKFAEKNQASQPDIRPL